MSESEKGLTPHRRYHFSPVQTMELNSAFSQNPYPSVKYRQELAARLGIDQKTVTTWFKNQRCRLPKLLRKQLLEVNGVNMKRTNALNIASQRLGQSDTNTNGVGIHSTHSLTGGISCLPANGLQSNPNSKLVTSNSEKMLPLQFGPLYNSIPTSEATTGDTSLLESMKNSLDEDKIQKTLAQILQIQKKNDDLGSSGTKTPDTVPEISSENNPIGISCNENIAKEEHIEKESNSSNTADVDMIDARSSLPTTISNPISCPKQADYFSMLPPHLMAAAAASWNIENYNLLMRSSQSTNRSLAGVPVEIPKPKPNHLWQLFTRYEEFLSEKAKNYLKIDFSLDQKLYQEPDTIQNEQIRDAIKRDWIDFFPKWMAGETGSGFEGLKSLIISDQIILTRLYKEELKHRTSEFK